MTKRRRRSKVQIVEKDKKGRILRIQPLDKYNPARPNILTPTKKEEKITADLLIKHVVLGNAFPLTEDEKAELRARLCWCPPAYQKQEP